MKINKQLAQSLRLRAEEAKKHLSSHDSFETDLNGDVLTINKVEFNELIRPLIDKTISCCQQALKDAGLKQQDIDTVVMVGGSTRVPAVKKP